MFRAQYLPQEGHVLGQVDLFYKGIRPNLFHQLSFIDYMPTMFYKNQQSVEGFRGERNMLSVTKQKSLGSVEAERSEFVKMSDLLAHNVQRSINKRSCPKTSKTLPEFFQDLGKTFYPFEVISLGPY